MRADTALDRFNQWVALGPKLANAGAAERLEYLAKLSELADDARAEALGDEDALGRIFRSEMDATDGWARMRSRIPDEAFAKGVPNRVAKARAEQFYAELEEGLAHDVRSSNQKNQQQNGGAHRGPDAAEAGGNAGVQPGDG